MKREREDNRHQAFCQPAYMEYSPLWHTSAHGEDLRVESQNEELAEAVKRDFRQAELTARELALCEFAEKLTLSPAKMTREDCEALRAFGLDDHGILDAVEVVSYFNYINRVADALGIDPEPEMLR